MCGSELHKLINYVLTRKSFVWVEEQKRGNKMCSIHYVGVP